MEDAGEVTVTEGLSDTEKVINIKVIDKLHVYGGGLVHAVSANINARDMTVDDLGRVIGDWNSIPCNADDQADEAAYTGNGKDGIGASGAGHGGRGGRGTNQRKTGGAYGDLFEPATHGCMGGKDGRHDGGNGGGIVNLIISGNLQIDGEVSANGQSAPNGAAGGGSGGSIYIETNLMRGYGDVTVNGGNGHACHGTNVGSTYCGFTSSSGVMSGGGGAAGRIAVYFSSNKTFSGSWQVSLGYKYLVYVTHIMNIFS